MFKNYLKISLRQIIRYKLHSFINIFGLVLGMTSFIIIFIWIRDELSYDRTFANKENLYQLTIRHPGGISDPNVPYALAPILAENYPEINLYTRIYRLSNLTSCSFKYDRDSLDPVTFYEDNVHFVDSGFFEMFSFPFTSGNKDQVFKNPNAVVLNKEIASRYFGDDDPAGRNLIFNNHKSFTVSGVVEVPFNTHLKIGVILPLDQDLKDDWNWRDPTYVLLNPQVNAAQFEEKITEVLKNHAPYPMDNMKIELLPISRSNVHFGKMKYIYIFSFIGIFILVIACINYVNMTNAHALIRIKEIGIRKIAGARQGQIIFQLLFESILLCLISLFISVMLIEAILPFFNSSFGKHLKIGYLENPELLLYLFLIALLFGLLAGLIPSLFMGRKSILPVSRSVPGFNGSPKGVGPVSVIIQITISILLISATAMIFKQLRFMQKAPLGFNMDYVVQLPINQEIGNRFNFYRNELLSSPRISHVTAGQALPYNEDYKTSGVNWQGKSPDFSPNVRYSITFNDYIETFDMEIVEGRSFSQDFRTDMSNFVINESAVQYMNLKEPIGERIEFWGIEGEIIGIIKDFHHVSLHREIMPQIFAIHPKNFGTLKYIFIKIDAEDVGGTLTFIENVTKKFAPDFPVDLSFVDEGVENLYRSEQQMGQIISYFSMLAIFISCLGIFGLTKFNVEKRNKEIGIRKVNGASIRSIILLLNMDLSRVVLIAFVMAVPISYVLVSAWLQNFAYKTNVPVWIFLVAGLLAFLSTLLSTGRVTYTAAKRNPLYSLRYE